MREGAHIDHQFVFNQELRVPGRRRVPEQVREDQLRDTGFSFKLGPHPTIANLDLAAMTGERDP